MINTDLWQFTGFLWYTHVTVSLKKFMPLKLYSLHCITLPDDKYIMWAGLRDLNQYSSTNFHYAIQVWSNVDKFKYLKFDDVWKMLKPSMLINLKVARGLPIIESNDYLQSITVDVSYGAHAKFVWWISIVVVLLLLNFKVLN